MKVLEKGHIYNLEVRKSGERDSGQLQQRLTFINKEPGNEHSGTTTQEVLRVLIDRTRHCANCMPHRNNEQAIYHLRMALIMHEARALERKCEKGDYAPEYATVGTDGHFSIFENMPEKLDTPILDPHRNDWDRECNHLVKEEV